MGGWIDVNIRLTPGPGHIAGRIQGSATYVDPPREMIEAATMALHNNLRFPITEDWAPIEVKEGVYIRSLVLERAQLPMSTFGAPNTYLTGQEELRIEFTL